MGNIYKIVSVFLFVLLIKAPNASYAQQQQAARILLFGDSIVAGYKHSEADRLDRQLEALLRKAGYLVEVINGGVSGDTTAGGVRRLQSTIEKHLPHITIIALGGNDLLRKKDPKVVRQNVDNMLRISREMRANVILSAVVAPADHGEYYQSQFNAIYPDLAAKYRVPLYPFLIQNTYGKPDLMQGDGVHPSPQGTKLIAQELAAYFIHAWKR